MSSVVSSIVKPVGDIVGGVTGGLMGGIGIGNAQAANPNISSPVSADELTSAKTGQNNALNQQAQFLQAVQGQNGLQNQSNVYGQLQSIANGTGPNPAQAQLAQATQANTANQAALMAGQRGASANPALIARQAAMQGAANQQNAAGQAATLGAQQQMSAIGQMGNIANDQAQMQANATQANTNANTAQQQQLLGAQGNYNNALLGQSGQQNELTLGNQTSKNNFIGNVMGAAGTALGMAKGGPVSMLGKHFCAMAKGGPVPALLSPGEKYLSPQAVAQVQQGAKPMQAGQTVPGTPKVGGAKNDYANDTVPATLQTGGIVLPRSVTQSKDKDEKARAFVAAILAKKGKGLKK